MGERDSASFSELLVDVQRRLEALYALDPEAPVTDFLIAYGQAGRPCPNGWGQERRGGLAGAAG